MQKQKIKSDFRRELLQGIVVRDLVFWTASYFILLNIFSSAATWQLIDHLYTSIFMVTLIMAVTVNSWVIIPRYLNQRKYALFFLFLVVDILGATFFNQLLFSKLIDYVLPGYYFISYYDYADLLRFFAVFVGLTTLLHLSWEWFQLQETKHRVTLLEKEKIDAEFKALSNQVNPHFLFNSLTVLYSLSLRNSSETSNAILKLSDILRHVIYESTTGEVSLKSEITLIHNDIDLQRYRIHPATRVEFDVYAQDENTPVVPMVFLPLVENSFKHGVKGDIENTFITIRLQSADGVLNFSIVNNKGNAVTVDKTSGGIGLKNIEDRLKLIYGNRYSLQVTETGYTFRVDLSIRR
jgi:sensor histidine kinase YesM